MARIKVQLFKPKLSTTELILFLCHFACQFFASRDKATAEAFKRLLERTGKREEKINFITERLKEELHVLGGFLDNISSRRPESKFNSYENMKKYYV